MFDRLANLPPTDVVIARDAAFITEYCYENLSAYTSSEPTSPSIGRVWRDQHRICWDEEDPDNDPENPSFVLRKKVPLHIVPSMAEISFIRRELGVDNKAILINQDIGDIVRLSERLNPTVEPQPEKLVDRENRNSEILVSISIRIPNTGLTSVLDHVRPAIDVAAQIKEASVNISIQPYNPDDDEEVSK
jgi:hypothetical protein